MKGTMRAGLLASALAVGSFNVAWAQSRSDGCEALIRAAQAGMEMRIRADDQAIMMPLSVRELTCMGPFFAGFMLDVLEDFLGALIGMVTEVVINAVCGLARDAWASLLGDIQCGITIQMFDIGFGGSMAGGNFCPTVALGGSGPLVFGASLAAGVSNAPYTTVSPIGPAGYELFLPDEALY